jgi:hypothetical protein
MSQVRNTEKSGVEVHYKVKRTLMCLMLFCSLCVVLPLANAQKGSTDLSFGLGTIHDKSIGTGLDYDYLTSCTTSTDSLCSTNASHLSGVVMGFSGDYMLTRRFGVGADVVFQPAKQDYVNFNAVSAGEKIQSRMTFYDFNGVAKPIQTKRAALQVEGGFGGANLKFYDSVNASSNLGNTNSSEYISSANHFQLHAGVSAPIYFKDHFFIRPQFDIHYVTNLDQQYGRDLVTQGMVWVGYSFGGQ